MVRVIEALSEFDELIAGGKPKDGETFPVPRCSSTFHNLFFPRRSFPYLKSFRASATRSPKGRTLVMPPLNPLSYLVVYTIHPS